MIVLWERIHSFLSARSAGKHLSHSLGGTAQGRGDLPGAPARECSEAEGTNSTLKLYLQLPVERAPLSLWNTEILGNQCETREVIEELSFPSLACCRGFQDVHSPGGEVNF